MNIGFIGFGEVGYEMSRGFQEQGNVEVFAFDPLYKEPFVQERGIEANVTLYDNPISVLNKVDTLIVAVPSNYCFRAWESLKGHIKPDKLYIDVTTAKATTKQKVISEILDGKESFVDAALMGPLPIYKHTVPIIASGKGVDTFINRMEIFGMNIEKVSDVAGDATNLKFIRSIFMKGMSALLYEVLDIATYLNVEDKVIESISETLDSRPFTQTVTRLISGTAIHSERRTKEMENVIQLLQEHNKYTHMSEATREKLSMITQLGLKEHFNNKAPTDWKEVFNKNKYKGV